MIFNSYTSRKFFNVTILWKLTQIVSRTISELNRKHSRILEASCSTSYCYPLHCPYSSTTAPLAPLCLLAGRAHCLDRVYRNPSILLLDLIFIQYLIYSRYLNTRWPGMGTNTLTHRSLFNCQSIAHRRSLKTKRFTTKPSIKSIAVAHNDRRIVAFAPLPRNINIRLKNIRYSTEYVLNNSQAGLISVLTSADVTDSRLWSFDGSWMGNLDDDRRS